MTNPTPCPHTDDAPLLALGALAEHEAAELRAHAPTCADCRRALAEHEALIGQLDRSLAREPAPAFDDLVFPRPEPVPARRPRRRRIAWAGAAAGLAAAAMLVLAFALGGGSPDPAAIASVAAEGAATTGEAQLFRPDRPDGLLKLQLRDVPTPAEGTYYAIWVLPRGQETMESVGTFVPREHSVDLELTLPGSGDYAAVDISIQRVGGPSAHSGQSLASGAFRSA